MDPGSLVSEEIEAGKELLRRFHELIPVKAAFWLKDSSEEGRWHLYIASDEIKDENIRDSYGKLSRVARELSQAADEMSSIFLDPFLVKLIPADDPLAQAALDINRRFPGNLPTRLGAHRFGGLTVDGAYIYPTSVFEHAERA